MRIENARVFVVLGALAAFAACTGEPRESLGTNTAAVSSCSPPCGGCTTPDPFAAIGGGICVSGGWIPRDHPDAACCVAAESNPGVCLMSCGGCTTPDPFVSLGGGTCVSGGWLPPGHPDIGCCVGAGTPGTVVCGDGVVAGGEQCDGSACCTSSCVFAADGTACSSGSCSAGTCVATVDTGTSYYAGCYTDEPSRALPTSLGSGHTVDSCAQQARSAGFAYAGVQYYGQCYAGNQLGKVHVSDSECNTPCTANPSQMCGGTWRNSIYRTAYAPASIGSRLRLMPGESLFAGQKVESTDGVDKLIYQADGNLVLYSSGAAVWSSGTAGTSVGRATLGTDGSLKVVDGAGATRWSSEPSSSPVAFLYLVTNKLVIETLESLLSRHEARVPGSGECRMTVRSHYAYHIPFFVHDAAELTFGGGGVARLNLQAGSDLISIGKCQSNETAAADGFDYRITYSEIWTAAQCQACQTAYLDEVGAGWKPYVAGQSNHAMARCFDAAGKPRLRYSEPALPAFVAPPGASSIRLGQSFADSSSRCDLTSTPRLEPTSFCEPSDLIVDPDCCCIDTSDPARRGVCESTIQNKIDTARRQCFDECMRQLGCSACERVCGVGCPAPKVCSEPDLVCGPAGGSCVYPGGSDDDADEPPPLEDDGPDGGDSGEYTECGWVQRDDCGWNADCDDRGCGGCWVAWKDC